MRRTTPLITVLAAGRGHGRHGHRDLFLPWLRPDGQSALSEDERQQRWLGPVAGRGWSG
jgi:hypothetical protein